MNKLQKITLVLLSHNVPNAESVAESILNILDDAKTHQKPKGSKTVIDWLSDLPEPIKSQALKNCIDFTSAARDLQDALEMAFIWKSSPEGFEYWRNYHEKLYYK